MSLLDLGTIERILQFSENAPVLLALSGGGDSAALLHLLTHGLGADRLRACVIDHALREESDAEAARAAGFAQALGVEASVVRLEWDQPGPRAQQEARRVRYVALCAEARRIGARVIALAHTRDDQAETVYLRAGGGSHWRGLAGIAAFAPAPLWPEGRELWVARPLLGVRRAALRALLVKAGAPWIEDPSNANPVFARVRARQRLASLENEGVDPMRLARLAETLAPAAAALDRAAAALVEAAASFEEAIVRLDRAGWSGGAAVRQRALTALIAAASGEDREAAPKGLIEAEAALTRPDFAGLTLGGARLRPVRGGVWLERDRGALTGRADGAQPLAPATLPPGEEKVWDGRVVLTAREPGWVASVGDGGAPILSRGGGAPCRLDETDAVTARWLLRQHAAHVLGEAALQP